MITRKPETGYLSEPDLRLLKAFVTLPVAALLFFGAAGSSIGAARLTAENVRIVDCLLPGKVKKLGINRTFISKKRPVKTSATDCEIRGGEYTQYDRADIASALAVWQGAAILGDSEAQYFVGEIFENGHGSEPNYKQALNWYRQSAEQDYSPALMALGRLHESGLGVQKDLVKAMNYYREASGLTDESIEYASVFEAIREKDLQKIGSLEGALEQEKKTTQQLSEQLNSLKTGLNQSDQRVKDLQKQINGKNKKIKELSQKVSQSPIGDTRELENQLSEARRELQKQNRLSLALQSELDLVKQSDSPDASVDFISNALASSKQELKAQTKKTEAKQKQILALKARLEKLQQSLEGLAPKKQLALVKKEYQGAKKQLDKELGQSRKEIKAQKKKITKLEKAVVKTSSSAKADAGERKLAEFELEKAKRQLVAREQESEQKKRKIGLLEQEIAFLKKQGKQSKSEQAASFAALKESLQQREMLFDDQIASLSLSLEKSQEETASLEQQLQAATDQNTDRNARIEELNLQIAEAEQKTAEANQEIAARDKLIGEKIGNIQSLNERIKQLPTVANLEQLKVTLAAQEQELKQERDKAFKLNKDISNLEQQKTSVEQRLAKVAPEDGPVIAVRWPKVEAASGSIAVVGAGSAVSVVGAVFPPKTITRFEIDGNETELDSNGMFLHVVDVGNESINMTLKAVDDQGKESVNILTIQPSFSSEFLTADNNSLTAPKVKFGKFHALVIGNNSYVTTGGWPALETAVSDAKEVARVLKEQYGFKVTLKLNASRDEMVIALEEMRRNLTDSDNLLIYYAGHGYMDPENDQGYWIPVNGSTSSSAGWVSNSTITEQIRATSAKNIMVIADSCYSASLTRSGIVSLRSGLSPAKKMERLKSDIDSITRMAFSSGGLQPVADSIDGSGHSVFANALLTQLKDNDTILDGSALATQVGLEVAVATKDNVQQVPQYSPLHKGGHQGGEFYFVPKRT